jgi:hypothetical protein
MRGEARNGESFAAHVHEVVGLDQRDTALATVEGRIDSITTNAEERSALWLLAASLRNGAYLDRVLSERAAEVNHA